MPSFGQASMGHLITCDEQLQVLCKVAIQVIDFSVIEGARTLEKQQEYFMQGKSKLDGLGRHKSKHQSIPSRAVDLMPYPGVINGVSVWDEPRRFHILAGVMLSCAQQLDIAITWGGDWDGDFVFSDQSFNDLPHFELKGMLL